MITIVTQDLQMKDSCTKNSSLVPRPGYEAIEEQLHEETALLRSLYQLLNEASHLTAFYT